MIDDKLAFEKMSASEQKSFFLDNEGIDLNNICIRSE